MSTPTAWVSKDVFDTLMRRGQIVDGRGGGLILGRSHAQGGILTIASYNLEQFVIQCSFEGDEYLVNAESCRMARARLEEINNYTGIHDMLTTLPITRKTRVINTHAEPHDKLIWIDMDGQFMVRREATAKYFNELEEINESENDTLDCDFDLVPKEAD